ncbi:MAG: SMP-30/gluconolactonase/LRE family protein [Alphaproteobacteria bacterium]|nr:SMP-30/gluconolactonase/LRE family protein [Alphaproteobacteria bacterium]
MARTVERILALKATLGECPRWRAEEQALYLVDIAAHRLHRFEPASGRLDTRQFDQSVGSFAFRQGGGLVLAMGDGFGLIDHFEGPVRPIGPRLPPGNGARFNDGRTDPAGRFYAGTIDPTRRDGAAGLFRLDPDGQVTRLFTGALTSNGAAFSPDGQSFAWSDTPRHALYRFDCDPAAGTLSNRRLWRAWPEGGGRPDGGSFDLEGGYWTALFEGGRLAHLSRDGEIVEEIALPCPKPTMAAFGGADGRTVFVTTAREGMSPADLAAWPQSGDVFAFEVEVAGVPEFAFAG